MEPKSGFHPENVDVCCTKQSDEQAENVHSVMVKQEKRNQGQVWSLFLFSFVYLVYIWSLSKDARPSERALLCFGCSSLWWPAGVSVICVFSLLSAETGCSDEAGPSGKVQALISYQHLWSFKLFRRFFHGICFLLERRSEEAAPRTSSKDHSAQREAGIQLCANELVSVGSFKAWPSVILEAEFTELSFQTKNRELGALQLHSGRSDTLRGQSSAQWYSLTSWAYVILISNIINERHRTASSGRDSGARLCLWLVLHHCHCVTGSLSFMSFGGRSFLPRGCLTLCVWGLSLWLCLVSGVHNSPCDIWIRWACYVTSVVSLSSVIFEHFHCASYFYLLPACFSLCLFCVWNILCSLLRHRAELKKTLLDKSLCRLKCAEMMSESGLAQIIVGKQKAVRVFVQAGILRNHRWLKSVSESRQISLALSSAPTWW